MTDYALEIERLTISLEEMEVKTASLSPRRFENLKNLIIELKDIDKKSLDDFNELWNRIVNEFKDLNQNYQDFLKKFQESKTEELLESTYFLEYKNKMISYLQDFIKGYLNNGNKIKNAIKELDGNIEELIVNKLEQRQRELPKISQDFNYKKFNDLNRGKWQSIVNWFEFKLYYKRLDGEKKELTDKAFAVFSGGEKAKTMYIPLFASICAKLSSAKLDAPRLIALDEAFAGVDDDNIEEMFAILSSFDLDYILTSQALWCDYSTVKDISICELVSDHISKTIGVKHYRWNGKVRISLDGDL